MSRERFELESPNVKLMKVVKKKKKKHIKSNSRISHSWPDQERWTPTGKKKYNDSANEAVMELQLQGYH